MTLSRSHRRYLLIENALLPAVINFFVNTVVGFVTYRNVRFIPVWGVSNSSIADTLSTCFLLPAITCVIATSIVRVQVRSGVIEPLAVPAPLSPVRSLLSRSVLPRAFLLGIASLVILSPFVFAFHASIDAESFPQRPFIWVKALWSGVFGAIVTPLIAVLALMDPYGKVGLTAKRES